jgi:hypothetical protein
VRSTSRYVTASIRRSSSARPSKALVSTADPKQTKALPPLVQDLASTADARVLPTCRRQRRGLRTAKFSGRGWDRTSDPSRVKRVLSR